MIRASFGSRKKILMGGQLRQIKKTQGVIKGGAKEEEIRN